MWYAHMSGDVVVVASAVPGAADAAEDERRRTARKDAGVTAILHETYPVRHWDAELGPAVPHLFWAGAVPAEGAAGDELRQSARCAL